MKNPAFLLSALFVVLPLSGQTTIALPEVRQPHQIAVDGNDLYVFDEADYSLRVYALSPFALKAKIGRKGDGPHDFKYLPYVCLQPETLTCTDFTKIIRYSKTGEVIKGVEFSEIKDFDLDSEMLLIPVKGNYLRVTAYHREHKRRVSLLDAEFKTIKQLYEGPFVWEDGDYISVRTDTLSAQGLAFIADTQQFKIAVFDDKGNLLRMIDKSREVEEVPGRARMHQFCVSGGKIYATTFRKKDDRTEMIVLDLDGRILGRIFLPLPSLRPTRGVMRFDPFTVDGEKLYELVQSRETGKWELRITDLKTAR